MRYLAAYLLASLNSQVEPTKDIVIGILKAGGIEVEEEKVNHLFKELHGKNINELIKAGQQKMSAVSSSAAPSVIATPSKTPANNVPIVEKQVEPVVETKPEEPSSGEDDGEGLMDFF